MDICDRLLERMLFIIFTIQGRVSGTQAQYLHFHIAFISSSRPTHLSFKPVFLDTFDSTATCRKQPGSTTPRSLPYPFLAFRRYASIPHSRGTSRKQSCRNKETREDAVGRGGGGRVNIPFIFPASPLTRSSRAQPSCPPPRPRGRACRRHPHPPPRRPRRRRGSPLRRQA